MYDLIGLLAKAGDGDTILIPVGEHRVNLVIRRPVRLRGRGESTHIQGAPGSPPTISILCNDVSIESLGVEHLDGIAIFCGPGVRPQLQNVAVRGRTEFAVGDGGGTSGAKVAPEAAGQDSPGVLRLLAQAEALEDVGKWAEAVSLYDRVVSLVPNHREAIALRKAALRYAKTSTSSQATAPKPTAASDQRRPPASVGAATVAPVSAQTPRVSLGAATPPGFVLVPAGSFTMGSPEDEPFRGALERQVKVTITRPFFVATHVTTQDAFMGEMGQNAAKEKAPQLPAYAMNWFDAVEYANKVSAREGLELCYDIEGRFLGLDKKGYRLPTSAEWEYFARAGVSAGIYGALDAISWHSGNSGHKPHPPGLKVPNAWGLFDVLGNVWEWTNDWSSKSYVQRDLRGGVDPTGEGKGDDRIVRGGSYYGDRGTLRFARTDSFGAMDSTLMPLYEPGIRLVRTAP